MLHSLHVRFKLNTRLVRRISLCRVQFRKPTLDSSTSQSFPVARIRSLQTLGLINSERLSTTIIVVDISAFSGKIRSSSSAGTNRTDTPYTSRARPLPVYSTRLAHVPLGSSRQRTGRTALGAIV